MSRYTKVIAVAGWVCMILMAAGQSGTAQSELKRRFDSLFVIASSPLIKYQDLVDPAKDSIAALGAPVVPLLIDEFTTKSARARWAIIQCLQRIGSPAVPDLVAALRREDGLVVQRVCWALGDIKDSAATLSLVDVSTHQRWQVRDQAIGALGKIGDSRSGETVMAALQDSIGQVRKAAAVSCGQLRLAQAVAGLVHLLGDDFYGARMSAYESLRKLDTPLVKSALVDSLPSTNQLTGDLACRLLGELGGDETLALLAREATADRPQRRAQALVAMIAADPWDNCGFIAPLLEQEPDRLVQLKAASAQRTYRHEPE